MRFSSPMAAFLAASISISGCTSITGDWPESKGSFRQAPTSELLVRAEQFEREGDYGHAARLYEELLRSDPSRVQVRRRLQALASYGILSSEAQGALTANVQEVIAQQHQERQLAERSSEPSAQPQFAATSPLPEEFSHLEITWADEPQSQTAAHAASQAPSPLISQSSPREFADVTARGVSQVELLPPPPSVEPPTPTRTPESLFATVTPPSPETPRAELAAADVATGPDSWQDTVIRSQEQTRRHFDSPTQINPETQTEDLAASDADADPQQPSRPIMAHVVSTGSNLWRAATNPEPESELQTENPTVAMGEPIAAERNAISSLEWAHSPAVDAIDSVTSAVSVSNDTGWCEPAEPVAPFAIAAIDDDAFVDPIVDDQQESSTRSDFSASRADQLMASSSTIPAIQRAQSAFATWKSSGSTSETVPALVELLEHEDTHIVEVACYFLGEFGPAAEVASPTLRTVRDTAEESTAILAAEALAKIEPGQRDSIDRIVGASRSIDIECRLLAAFTLGGVDASHSETVVPALAYLLNDENAEVRSAAALSLGGFGHAASACTSKLEELALGDMPEVRESARIALQCIEQ